MDTEMKRVSFDETVLMVLIPTRTDGEGIPPRQKCISEVLRDTVGSMNLINKHMGALESNAFFSSNIRRKIQEEQIIPIVNNIMHHPDIYHLVTNTYLRDYRNKRHSPGDQIMADFYNTLVDGFPDGKCICKSKDSNGKIYVLVDPSPDDFTESMEYCLVISTVSYIGDRVPKLRLLIDTI